jgi:alpha-glucosidase
MPWDNSANAGFTAGDPWLPLGEDHSIRNVEQMHDTSSMLALTRALLELRRREPSLSVGDWAPLAVEGDVLAFIRNRDGRRFAVVLNLEPLPKAIRFSEDLGGRTVLSTHPGRSGYRIRDCTDLDADEAMIIALGMPPA